MNIDNTFIQQMSITFHDNKENKYCPIIFSLPFLSIEIIEIIFF